MAAPAVERVEPVLDAHWTDGHQRAAAEDGWAPELWEALVEAGLPWLSVPPSSGGAGGSVGDAGALLRLLGRRAAPVPVAEAGLLAGWLLAACGLEVPRAHVAVGGWHPRDEVELRRGAAGLELDCRLHRVAWAGQADRLVVLARGGEGTWRVVLVGTGNVQITPGRNLAGEPRDGVAASGAPVDEIGEAPPGVDREALWLRGAFTRAVLLAGAMERIAEQTIDYANAREQFGRPIARFQAVQQHLVRLSSEAALAGMAADVAAGALEAGGGAFEVGVAKAVASRAAGVVGGLAHQVHGAIGMTEESSLSLLTRRLWTWRQEFGSARWWNRRVGQGLVHGGADRLWSRLAG